MKKKQIIDGKRKKRRKCKYRWNENNEEAKEGNEKKRNGRNDVYVRLKKKQMIDGRR